MNALDKRTYMPFTPSGLLLSPEELQAQRKMDLNSIPLVERRHCCYTRGLAFDLLGWFQNRYHLFNPADTLPSASSTELTPVVGMFGRDLVRYKRKAVEDGIPGVCSVRAFERQIEMALFSFQGMEEGYSMAVQDEETDENKERYAAGDLDLPFVYTGWRLEAYSATQHFHEPMVDFFKEGRNRADNKYFFGIGSEFV